MGYQPETQQWGTAKEAAMGVQLSKLLFNYLRSGCFLFGGLKKSVRLVLGHPVLADERGVEGQFQFLCRGGA